MLAMLRREPCRGHSPDAAVRANLVVITPPIGDHGPGLLERLEPVLVQAFVAESPVEALDVAVLHGPAWLDQDVPDAATLRPSDERPAGELRAVVGSHGRWVATEQGGLIQKPGDVLAAHAVVHRNVHAFMAEVIGYGQTLQPPAIGQAVAHKVHAPHLVDSLCQVQGRPLRRWPADLLALAHGQIRITVQAIHPLVIDAREIRSKKIMHTPIAKAPAGVGDLDDLGLQRLRLFAVHRRMAVTVSAQPHKSAGPALGQLMLVDQSPDGGPLGLWG